MKYIILCLALQGCATTDFLANRISCTLDGKTGFVNSMYGPIGITSKVAKADSEVLCKSPTNPATNTK